MSRSSRGELAAFRLYDFSGGIRLDLGDYRTPLNALRICLNFDIESGALKKRKGRIAYNSVSIRGLADYEE